MKAEEAIKEFAEKVMKEYCRWWSIEARDTDKFISDLTTLISEHYYPKEFVFWFLTKGQFTFFFSVNNDTCPFEEAFNYWKENER